MSNKIKVEPSESGQSPEEDPKMSCLNAMEESELLKELDLCQQRVTQIKKHLSSKNSSHENFNKRSTF